MAVIEHTPDERSVLQRRRGPKRTKFELENYYPIWTHPQVLYWAPTWALIRDCILGEQEIKKKETLYLPPLDEQSSKEYRAYLERAVFFNMVGRTINALTGIVFQKKPKVEGLPDKEKIAFRNPTRTGISLESYLKCLTYELLATGRVGAMLDMDESGKAFPYFAYYTAENILDWQVAEVEGKLTPVEIVLREIIELPRAFRERTIKIVYRQLKLELDGLGKYVYRQYIYESERLDQDLTNLTPRVVTPNRRGVPFDRIPFKFIGAMSNTADIDRSPTADIASINLAHYRAYAQLEHGRFYTAMPIYYAQTQAGQSGDYRIGSAVVWEVGLNEKPGVIEFNGAGLKYLESSCSQKEDQIAALGGRLMGGKDRSTAESDNEVKLKEGNERSILLNVVMGINEAMTDLFRLWLWWRDHDMTETTESAIELNSHFLMDTLGARELRAIYAMYKDGVVPVTVLHFYLQQAEAIPDWMDATEFKRLLDDEKEFPNQPDVLARMMGFPSATELLNQKIKERQAAVQERLATVKEGELELEAEIVHNPPPVPVAVPKIKPGTAK